MVRHDDRVGAQIGGAHGVLGVEDTLQDHLAAPHVHQLLHAVPVERVVEFLRRPRGQRGGIGDPLHMADHVAETAPLGAQHAKAPAPLGGEVDHVGQRRFRRGGEAVLDVLVPLAQHLQVQRDDERRTPRVARPVDQALHVIVVGQRIDLKPKGFFGVLGDVLDGTDRQGREGEGHAECLGGAGGLDLAVGALHPGHAHRGQRHRHGDILTDHPARGAAVRHVHRDPLAQTNLAEITDVFAEGLFRPAAGLGVIVEHLRHPSAVDPLQILDIGNDWHADLPNSGEIFLPI